MKINTYCGLNKSSQKYWRGTKIVTLLTFMSVFMALAASSAFAGKFAVTSVDVTPPSNQAGNRGGEIGIGMNFDSENASRWASKADGDTLKNLTLTMPKGFLGNPNGPDKCSEADFRGSSCIDSAQVGWVNVDTYFTMRLWLAAVIGAACGPCIQYVGMWAPLSVDGGKVYNLEPREGKLARFGFEIPVKIGGISLTTMYLTSDVTVDPDNEHRIVVKTTDEVPHNMLSGGAEFAVTRMSVRLGSPDTGGGPKFEPTLPTFCHQPAEVDVDAEAHNGLTGSSKGGFPVNDCNTLKFDPALSITPGNAENRTSTPYPYEFAMSIPRDSVRSQSALAGVRIPMPTGFRLSPGVADGLSSCTPGEFYIGKQSEPAKCPADSEIGTAEIQLKELGNSPLTGKVFLGEVRTIPDAQGKPERLENQLYIELADSRIRYKAIGNLDVAKDGHLTAVFGQDGDAVGGSAPLLGLPWEKLKMNLANRGGRGALVNTFCGMDQSGRAVFTPWSEAPFPTGSTKTTLQPNVPTSSTWYDPVTMKPAGCPANRNFKPSFTASFSSDRASTRSDGLELTVNRSPYDRDLGAMTVQLPAGTLPSDPGVYCDVLVAKKDPAACPKASQLGDLSASVGFGSETLTLPGKVVAAAPTGMSIVNLVMVLDADLPAFKLGKVAIESRVEPIAGRYAIKVDQGQIPDMIAGVPAPVQSFAVKVSSSGFIRNPFTCAAGSWQFDATFDSTGTTPASHATSYQMPCKP